MVPIFCFRTGIRASCGGRNFKDRADMNRLLKTFLLIIVGFALMLWFAGDETLDAGVVQWQDWHQRHSGRPGTGHLYLLGLNGPVDMAPIEAGQAWFQAHLDAREVDNVPFATAHRAPWVEHQLSVPRFAQALDLLDCGHDGNPDCILRSAMLVEHALLLERYKDWPSATEMKVAGTDLWLAPHFQTLISADHLLWLEIGMRLDQGDQGGAAELIKASFSKGRDYLQQAGSLLHMMVAIRLINDQVERLLSLHGTGRLPELDVDALLRSPDDMGAVLYQVMRGEFGQAMEGYAWADVHREELTDDRWLQTWMSRLFFRKNISVNVSHDLYRWIAGLDQPPKLSAHIRGSEPGWTRPFSLRNLYTWIHPTLMPEDATPYLAYVGRLHDLDAKLALARAYLANPSLEDADLRALVRHNPYRRGYGVELRQVSQRLCLDGPLEDNANFRCIPVAMPQS
jgi:hypothetical protein